MRHFRTRSSLSTLILLRALSESEAHRNLSWDETNELVSVLPGTRGMRLTYYRLLCQLSGVSLAVYSR